MTDPDDSAPDEPTPETPSEKTETARERAARRRRLDEVFGDVLPEQTSDDRADERGAEDAQEEWLRRQVPPHHG